MNCNRNKDDLISYLLDTLDKEEKEFLETHLISCSQCQIKLKKLRKSRILLKDCEPIIPPYNSKQFRKKILGDLIAQRLIEKKVSKELFSETNETEKKKIDSNALKISQDFVVRMFNRRAIATIATVLVVFSIVLVINFIDKSNAPGVAWGKLIEKIENIDFYTFKSQSIIIDINGSFYIPERNKYYVSKDGFRIDRHYTRIFYDIVDYGSWSDKTYITVFPEIKKYTRIFLTDERINRIDFLNDPRLFINLLKSFSYTKLGNKIIDGKEAEGIEIDNPKFGKMGFESCLVRIWADTDTNLPIFLALEATSGHGRVETKIVFDTFEWNGEYDSSQFEPNLTGYSLMAEVETMPINEMSTIEALQRFAQITGGKYPSSMAYTQNLIEIYSLYYKSYKERRGTGERFWEEEGFDWEGYTSLRSQLITACMFYGELFNNNKGVAYYGEKVTSNDFNLPLMRWKISNNEYRVIFGDLMTEDMNAGQLAELESVLNK